MLQISLKDMNLTLSGFCLFFLPSVRFPISHALKFIVKFIWALNLLHMKQIELKMYIFTGGIFSTKHSLGGIANCGQRY